MLKYFQSETKNFLCGEAEGAVEKQKVAQFLPALLLKKQAVKHNHHHWEQYKKAKNEVNASIKAAKTKYLSDRIKNSSGNKLQKLLRSQIQYNCYK